MKVQVVKERKWAGCVYRGNDKSRAFHNLDTAIDIERERENLYLFTDFIHLFTYYCLRECLYMCMS